MFIQPQISTKRTRSIGVLEKPEKPPTPPESRSHPIHPIHPSREVATEPAVATDPPEASSLQTAPYGAVAAPWTSGSLASRTGEVVNGLGFGRCEGFLGESSWRIRSFSTSGMNVAGGEVGVRRAPRSLSPPALDGTNMQDTHRAKHLSHGQTNGETGGGTSEETRQQRQTKRRSQQTSGETRKKERKKGMSA